MGDQQDASSPFQAPVAGGGPTLSVRAGEIWRISAHGDWFDGRRRCGPQGYRNFIPYVFDLRAEVEDAPYGCLIGRLSGEDGSGFEIGLGAIRRFESDGTIEFACNLRARHRAAAQGGVSVIAERLDAFPPRDRGLGAAWTLLRRTVDRTAGLTSISALTLGVGAALAFLPQGQDLVRTVSEPRLDHIAPQIWFALSVFLLSMQAWFWSRTIVNFNYGSDRVRWTPRAFLVIYPRAIGLAPGGFALWAMFRSPFVSVGLATGIVAAVVAIFVWVLCRQDAWRAIKARRRAKRGKPPLRVGRFWVLVWLISSFAAFAALWLSPIDVARWFGPPAVVFIGVSMIIPTLVIAIQSGAPIRFPALAALAALAFVISFDFDNHEVGRRAGLGAKATMGPYTRYDLNTAYDTWRRQAKVDPRDGSLPMVLVAAEGGASRAGYWTGEVLSQLHARTGGDSARAIFAISSVSGGSVGAVGYAAALQDFRHDPTALRSQVERLTGDDALSPTVGAMLFGDLAQRFLPLGFPDRAEALERSWEVSWREGCRYGPRCLGDRMAEPFLAIWQDRDPQWTPLVIVNGASEESGRRVLTSKLALRADQVNALDFYATTGRNIPASTAIHNGARFPYISPAGTMMDIRGDRHGHVIDGGYFDPAGTEVVRELARAIVEGPGSADKARLKFIFVFVGYGRSAIPPDGASPPAGPMPAGPATSSFSNEVLAPLRGMIASRGGHAQHMARNLKADVKADGLEQFPGLYASGPNAGAALRGAYIPILLCDDSDQPQKPVRQRFIMPMDWALSPEARRRMEHAVQDCGANASLMTVLADAIPRQSP